MDVLNFVRTLSLNIDWNLVMGPFIDKPTKRLIPISNKLTSIILKTIESCLKELDINNNYNNALLWTCLKVLTHIKVQNNSKIEETLSATYDFLISKQGKFLVTAV